MTLLFQVGIVFILSIFFVVTFNLIIDVYEMILGDLIVKGIEIGIFEAVLLVIISIVILNFALTH